MKDQKDALWECLTNKLAELTRQQSEEGEEESRVEITMEMSAMEMSELDATIIEQGKLLAADQPVEDKVYKRLAKVELNDIQWRYEVLSYLTSIIQINKEVCKRGDNTRTPREAYPKIWVYLGLRNLLTKYEKDTGMEDRYMLADARFKAAEKMHRDWKAQQKRV